MFISDAIKIVYREFSNVSLTFFRNFRAVPNSINCCLSIYRKVFHYEKVLETGKNRLFQISTRRLKRSHIWTKSRKVFAILSHAPQNFPRLFSSKSTMNENFLVNACRTLTETFQARKYFPIRHVCGLIILLSGR